MEVDVYDTYARSSDGQIIHFDVLVPRGTDGDTAFAFAKKWLEDIGENSKDLDQSRCRFCHAEKARSEVEKDIQAQGYYILQLEGCPQPIR